MIRSDLASFILATCLLSACSTNPFTGEQQVSNTAIGAGAGAALGAGAGYATGSLTNADPKQSALIGAGVGAVVGTAGGFLLDQRDKKIGDELQASGVSVMRSGKYVQLNMNKSVHFIAGTSKLTPDSLPILDSVVRVLAQYSHSHATIAAYIGTSENRDLEDRRAASVAGYFVTKGIAKSRLSVAPGSGEPEVQISLDQAG